MSLDFDGNSRDIEIPTSTSLEGTRSNFSALIWLFCTDSAKDDGILYRLGDSAECWRLIFDDSSQTIQFVIFRATTLAQHQSNTGAISLNTWQCVAVNYDDAAAGNLYVGDLTTPLAEVSYSADNAGSGTQLIADGLFHIGNSSVTQASRFFNGRIAVVKHWDEKLTLNQLIAQQFGNQPLASTVLYQEVGTSGTTTQTDLSGNGNSGTITSATVADHVPLSNPFGWIVTSPYIVAAAAGRIMSSLASHGGLAGKGGIAGQGGGLAG